MLEKIRFYLIKLSPLRPIYEQNQDGSPKLDEKGQLKAVRYNLNLKNFLILFIVLVALFYAIKHYYKQILKKIKL